MWFTNSLNDSTSYSKLASFCNFSRFIVAGTPH